MLQSFYVYIHVTVEVTALSLLRVFTLCECVSVHMCFLTVVASWLSCAIIFLHAFSEGIGLLGFWKYKCISRTNSKTTKKKKMSTSIKKAVRNGTLEQLHQTTWGSSAFNIYNKYICMASQQLNETIFHRASSLQCYQGHHIAQHVVLLGLLELSGKEWTLRSRVLTPMPSTTLHNLFALDEALSLPRFAVIDCADFCFNISAKNKISCEVDYPRLAKTVTSSKTKRLMGAYQGLL